MNVKYEWTWGPAVISGLPTVEREILRNYSFMDIYSIDFSLCGSATSMTEGLLNGDGIAFCRVGFAGRFSATVVASTVPQGRSDGEEFAVLLEREKQSGNDILARLGPGRFTVQTKDSSWGEIIELRIADVAEQDSNGPFPLSRVLFTQKPEGFHSFAVSHLFVRGGNRFEIAVLGVPEQEHADSVALLEQKLVTLGKV
ncbi:hypothetical protein WCN79_16240 [Xanthomonas axonopodis pv. vasculorum]|uniref:hypothetical protein n=2 Tax=Xanthomonas axonopodis TaxID=53413 RepID=UPI000D404545|nr:hypothetical protein [Xanthomonas axonopodis]PPV09936.1 hypothetical protein XavaCFBP5823_11440 [Xanthomonas axonopodis pv. vasculorum]QKD86212.1 hypothetical protein XAV_07070 [Xanthomonas axonopodis pv. vasculorum]